ncbi:protein-(glutamine-N5) methyltransferase, release factor-specific, partial [Enterococcus hirae]
GLSFEPKSALVSGQDGLSAIQLIVKAAPHYLKNAGLLIVEHGYNQAAQVAALFQQNGFAKVESHRDLGGNPRFTKGVKNA